MFAVLSSVTAAILFAMLGANGVLMMKERKRLREIEPSIME